MLKHRMQILLDEERYEKLAREARRRGLSIGAMIRDAIDRLPENTERRRDAIARILAAEPIDVPADPAELRAELDAAHDRIPQ